MMSGLRENRSPSFHPVTSRRQHVDDEEGRGERTHLLVSGMKLLLNKRDFPRQDVPVDVVQQIERNQQHQRHKCRAESRAKSG